jgi:hypothetical protein
LKYAIALTTLSLNLLTGYAQQREAINPMIHTVKWEYGNAENKLRSERLTIRGHLISYGQKKLVWAQDGTDVLYSIDIKSTKGDWQDVAKNGELIYAVQCEGIDGTIRIWRDQGQLRMQLDFSQPDKLTPNLLLEIHAFSKI